MQDADGKKRYLEMLSKIGGLDQYQTARNEWLDDIDLWLSVTSVHIGMYLLVTPSPYTGKDLVNYKSLDCYMNFLSGWVREILVKKQGDNRVVIAKVILMSIEYPRMRLNVRCGSRQSTGWTFALLLQQ